MKTKPIVYSNLQDRKDSFNQSLARADNDCGGSSYKDAELHVQMLLRNNISARVFDIFGRPIKRMSDAEIRELLEA